MVALTAKYPLASATPADQGEDNSQTGIKRQREENNPTNPSVPVNPALSSTQQAVAPAAMAGNDDELQRVPASPRVTHD